MGARGALSGILPAHYDSLMATCKSMCEAVKDGGGIPYQTSESGADKTGGNEEIYRKKERDRTDRHGDGSVVQYLAGDCRDVA